MYGLGINESISPSTTSLISWKHWKNLQTNEIESIQVHYYPISLYNTHDNELNIQLMYTSIHTNSFVHLNLTSSSNIFYHLLACDSLYKIDGYINDAIVCYRNISNEDELIEVSTPLTWLQCNFDLICIKSWIQSHVHKLQLLYHLQYDTHLPKGGLLQYTSFSRMVTGYPIDVGQLSIESIERTCYHLYELILDTSNHQRDLWNHICELSKLTLEQRHLFIDMEYTRRVVSIYLNAGSKELALCIFMNYWLRMSGLQANQVVCSKYTMMTMIQLVDNKIASYALGTHSDLIAMFVNILLEYNILMVRHHVVEDNTLDDVIQGLQSIQLICLKYIYYCQRIQPVEDLFTRGLFLLAYQGFTHGYHLVVIREWMKLIKMIQGNKLILNINSLESNKEYARVGFISSFFYSHSIGRLLSRVIVSLNSRLDVHLIHIVDPPINPSDEIIQYLYSNLPKANIIQVHSSQSIKSIQLLLQQRHLDVLVFADLFMNPLVTYLSLLRLASVQIAFWGHPMSSSNESHIDYFIANEDMIDDALVLQFDEQLILMKSLGFDLFPYERPSVSSVDTNPSTTMNDMNTPTPYQRPSVREDDTNANTTIDNVNTSMSYGPSVSEDYTNTNTIIDDFNTLIPKQPYVREVITNSNNINTIASQPSVNKVNSEISITIYDIINLQRNITLVQDSPHRYYCVLQSLMKMSPEFDDIIVNVS